MQHINNDCVLKNSVSRKDHQNLLIAIATSFGFNRKQSEDFMQEICGNENSHYPSSKTRHLSIRIYLSKLMVSKCIFKISEKLCSQDNKRVSTTLSPGNYFGSISTYSLKLQEMPLSYRSVFILSNTLGFTEDEIAELLNITPIKVKERMSKANYFLNNSSTKLIA